jgi:hypothetical protein
MTRRTNKHHNKHVGGLTAFLLTGSVIATFAGARLLALQEPVDSNAVPQPATIVEQVGQAENSPVLTLPQSGRDTTIQLKPIPQVVSPRFNIVTRSHSSM